MSKNLQPYLFFLCLFLLASAQAALKNDVYETTKMVTSNEPIEVEFFINEVPACKENYDGSDCVSSQPQNFCSFEVIAPILNINGMKFSSHSMLVDNSAWGELRNQAQCETLILKWKSQLPKEDETVFKLKRREETFYFRIDSQCHKDFRVFEELIIEGVSGVFTAALAEPRVEPVDQARCRR